MRIHLIAAGAMLCVLTTTSYSQVPHSARGAKGVETLGSADQNAATHFSVYLPLTHTDKLEQLLRDQTDSTSANYHHWLTPAQFKSQFGPSAFDVAKARAALEAGGFTVVVEKTQGLEV